MANKKIDCKGLNCPMPIVMISKAFKTMEIGDILEVEATDPAFRADVEAWVRKTEQELVNFQENDISKATLKRII